jgi:hypothetical protein
LTIKNAFPFRALFQASPDKKRRWSAGCSERIFGEVKPSLMRDRLE